MQLKKFIPAEKIELMTTDCFKNLINLDIEYLKLIHDNSN